MAKMNEEIDGLAYENLHELAESLLKNRDINAHEEMIKNLKPMEIKTALEILGRFVTKETVKK